MHLRRRDIVQGAGWASLAASLTFRSAIAQQPTLRVAAARVGIRFGANPWNYPPIFSPIYDQLVVEQCSLVVPNLSWALVEPKQGVSRPNADLGVVFFARAHNLLLTGYTLLWYYRMPGWFEALNSRTAAEQAVQRHIADMGVRYADQSWSVTVLNEALHVEDGRRDGLRNDALARVFGAAYWDVAFRAARRAYPHTMLIYNETYMEQEHHGGLAARRKAMLAQLDVLRAAGTPIDAVGLQSHLTLAQAFDEAAWLAFLREIAARGLKIVITELDVLDAGAPANIATRDQAVADMYTRFLTPTLDQNAVTGLVVWGLSDRYTWLVPASSTSFARRDGRPTRPLPFDADLRPKPAYQAVLRALQGAPARPAWTSA